MERFPQYAFLAINISLEIEIFFGAYPEMTLCDFGGKCAYEYWVQ